MSYLVRILGRLGTRILRDFSGAGHKVAGNVVLYTAGGAAIDHWVWGNPWSLPLVAALLGMTLGLILLAAVVPLDGDDDG